VEDPSFAVSQIASDNVGGGEAAFKAIEELAPDGGKVLVVSTDPGVSTVDARAKGFEDAAKGNADFEFLGVQYSHNEPAQAAKIVTAALQKDPDIVGIFATNVFSAEGSATGIRQAGKQGEVNVVGFDAGPAQVEQLREGTVQALIAQQPDDIGAQGVQQALAALDGESTKKEIQTGSTIITKDNVDGEGKDALYKSSC
jgi:ribose transport system substrate-binding protein